MTEQRKRSNRLRDLRKAFGLCAYSNGCKGELFAGTRLCRKHRRARKLLDARVKPKRRLEHKLAGLCTNNGCINAAGDTVNCASCEAKMKARRKRYSATEHGKHIHREQWRRLRKRRVAKGLCGDCGHEPLVTATLGVKCRGPVRKPPQRVPLPDAFSMTGYDYATARNYHEAG